jgi:ribosomal protein S12 methylthiotransferase
VVSLGCPKNRVDTEVMLGLLIQAGYAVSGDPGEADVIIVNTCGFIEAAKQESIDTILEMAQYKQDGRCAALLVTGCLTQRYLNALSEELPEVDGFLGVNDYPHIVEVLDALMAGRRVVGWEQCPCDLPMRSRALTTPFYTAYVKIAEGCDNRCSYCAIPDIRGRFRSRAPEDIIEECRGLAADGVREVVLIAQDTTRYGEDLAGKPLLTDLLTALNAIESLTWIRVLYCYPERITDALLDAFLRLPKVCRYLDIPIQHIDGDILKAMHRRSTPGQIRALLTGIRARNAGFALRTSLIAGFPGETQEQFEALCAFIQEHPFEHLGAFAFSPEEGTPAAKLPGAVPKRTRERRRDKLMEIQAAVVQRLNADLPGRVYAVLTEGYDEESGLYFGRSAAQAPEIDEKVFFSAPSGAEPGDFVRVRMTGSDGYDWLGEVTNEPSE